VTKVVADQTGRPTYSRDLARAIWQLVVTGAQGVLHVANQGDATWFDVASHVFAHMGKPDLVRSCLTAEYPTAARRPRSSVLSTSRAERDFGIALPDWRTSLDHFLESIGEGDLGTTP